MITVGRFCHHSGFERDAHRDRFELSDLHEGAIDLS